MNKLLIILSLALAVSCASKKNSASNNEKTTQTKSMSDTAAIGKEEVLPLIVQFYSIGTGVKEVTKTMLDTYVSDFEKAANKKVSYKAVPWGREGEVDACFRLSELNEEQKQSFISGLKKLFTEEHHVHIIENQSCKYIR